MAAKGVVIELPTFDMNTMTTLLFGLLGMSGMRSWEKVKGRA
jgi:xanthine/uracil permease